MKLESNRFNFRLELAHPYLLFIEVRCPDETTTSFYINKRIYEMACEFAPYLGEREMWTERIEAMTAILKAQIGALNPGCLAGQELRFLLEAIHSLDLKTQLDTVVLSIQVDFMPIDEMNIKKVIYECVRRRSVEDLSQLVRKYDLHSLNNAKPGDILCFECPMEPHTTCYKAIPKFYEVRETLPPPQEGTRRWVLREICGDPDQLERPVSVGLWETLDCNYKWLGRRWNSASWVLFITAEILKREPECSQ